MGRQGRYDSADRQKANRLGAVQKADAYNKGEVIMAKKETLKEQQARLDKEKWCRSVATSCDQSGVMWYCKDCTKRIGDYHCHATQTERENGSLCAKNARKLKRG